MCVSIGFGAALRRPMERLYSWQPHRKWPGGVFPLQHGGSDQEGRWPPTSQRCVCVFWVGGCMCGRMCVWAQQMLCSYSWSLVVDSCSIIGLFRQLICFSQPVNHLPVTQDCPLLTVNTPPSSLPLFLLLLSPSLVNKPNLGPVSQSQISGLASYLWL